MTDTSTVWEMLKSRVWRSPFFPLPEGSSWFSDDFVYRYLLTRTWSKTDKSKYCFFIMLNASTADEWHNDPSVTRVIRFSQLWGFQGLYLGNLHGLRSTDPKQLYTADDPTGPFNEYVLIDVAQRPEVGMIIAAWGNHGRHLDAGQRIRRILHQQGHTLHHLGLTKHGQPRHPLYLRRDTKPKEWPYA